MRISIKTIIYGMLLVSLISGCEKNLPQYIEIYHNGFDNEKGDILVFKGDNVDNSEKIFTYNNILSIFIKNIYIYSFNII